MGEYKANLVMSSASTIRREIESALAHRFPAALSPTANTIRPVVPTGIANIDELLRGGIPVGALTEIVGPHSSGRTSLTLAILANLTEVAKVCAWIDVSDSLDPESVAAAGVDLNRLLWVRCGVNSSIQEASAPTHRFALPDKYMIPPVVHKGLHGGGHGPHPRTEIKGMDDGVSNLFHCQTTQCNRADPQRRVKEERVIFTPSLRRLSDNSSTIYTSNTSSLELEKERSPKFNATPLTQISQAIRATDLLLQAGGFACTVLDMSSIAPEHVSRIPLATWFRYRTAAERTRVSFILLSQYPCAKSSAGLVLHLAQGQPLEGTPTIFTGMSYKVEIQKERFTPTPASVMPIRKPPKSEHNVQFTRWDSQALSPSLR